MTHGSLFSGIGGFDLAAEWMGWDNIFHCEWNEFGQRVLKHYWPKAISYEDITKTDFTIHRGRIDVLTGGFPCQPYSTAGKRLGKEDDRHLWPEMLRAIREIQPRWVVGENVRGLTNWNGGLVFDEVQADLEAEGYEVTPFLLPACGVNAPHRRDIIWFIANSINGRDKRLTGEHESQSRKERVQKRNEIQQSKESDRIRSEVDASTPDSSCIRCNNGSDNRKKRHVQNNSNRDAEKDKSERSGWKFGSCKTCEVGDATYSNDKRLQRGEKQGGSKKIGKNRDEQFARFIQSDWEEFPTQSPICDGDDGLSSRLDGITFPKWRNESIKAGGNAIVPQVAHQIFKAIQEYDHNSQLRNT
jgi:DNA (cytosine-5)-methyltransferase 1